MMMNLDKIQEDVNELYAFRENYFQNHKLEDACKKDELIQQRLTEVLATIDSVKDSIPSERKGEYHYLKGRALNVVAEYNKNAEDELGRATKFNYPSAWNELGECLYKKGDLNSAKTCFQKALDTEKSAVYLRNMSMLMRSLPWKSQEERQENIAKGHEFAKEALKMNIKDGHSWLVLGNSLLASFFAVEAKQEVLKNCKAAYIKSEEDPTAAHLPELHYSKFQVAWYEEDYKAALSCLKKAHNFEPTWTQSLTKLEECKRFLTRLSNLVHTKGQLSQRKLNALITGISDNQLGPYETGGTPLTGGIKPTLVSLRLLAEGTNHEKIVLGRVVCTVVPESGLPFAFCMVDRDGTCRAVTVYNWASNCGVKIGDSIAIVAPVLKRHRLEEEKIEEFFSLRVILPIMLVVNKRCVATNQVIASQIVSQKKAE